MAISRDKDENRRLTQELMLTNEPIERTDPKLPRKIEDSAELNIIRRSQIENSA
jgi:hypothetical protein